VETGLEDRPVFPARLLHLSSAYQDWRRPEDTVDKDNQTISDMANRKGGSPSALNIR